MRWLLLCGCATGIFVQLAACQASSPSSSVQAPAAIAQTVTVPSTRPAGEPATALRAAELPPGWIAPTGAALPPREPGPKSLRRLMENLAPRRAAVAPTEVRIADLPRVEIEAPPKLDHDPVVATAGEPDTDLLIFDEHGKTRSSRPPGESIGVRLTVKNRPLGTIMGEPFYPWAEGGGMAYCGTPGGTGWRSTEWVAVSPASASSDEIVFERTRGWFDHQTCRGFVKYRMKAAARPLAGGIAYAFRTSCPGCDAAARDVLHVLTPSAESTSAGEDTHVESWGMPFLHAEFSLVPGHAGSLAAVFRPAAIETFKKGGARTDRTSHTLFGMEVARAVGEADATAVVYVADAPAP